MPVISSCLISAGEHSGDILAAEFIRACKAQGASWDWVGICGDNMVACGARPLAMLEDLSVMGFIDVMKKLTHLRVIQKKLLLEVERQNIQLAILVDYPGFHFQLAKQLKIRGVKVIQFVAPKVWAWGEHRLAYLRRDFDLVLGILPFEDAYFKKHGVPYSYIGTPHKDRVQDVGQQKVKLGFSNEKPLLACLPGSRRSEIEKVAQVMEDSLRLVLAQFPDLQIGIPVPANLDQELVKQHFPLVGEGRIRLLEGQSLELMACSDAALLTSGTATLECGLLGTPMIVVYKMDTISYILAKRKVKVPWISLVNLIMQRKVVSEYIQKIDVSQMSAELSELLRKGPAYQEMKDALQAMADLLADNAGAKAATETLAFVQQRFSHK